MGQRHGAKDRRAQDTRVRNRRASAVGLALALVLSGCTSGAVVPKPSDTPVKPSPSYVSTYQPPAATDLAPLRGTTVAAGSLAHASIAAKIDNHWDARPQIGLESTDIVYEELVEGGITRYVAVWQSTIPKVFGPVRSIRPMDPNIVSPLGGIICYSGGQPRFVNLMRRAPVYNAIHGQPDTASSFYRTPTKAAPHNVLVNGVKLLALHKKIAPPKQQFAYSLDPASSTAAKDGSPTKVIKYTFSTAMSGAWTYDAAHKVFLRSQAGKKDKDSAGAQLKATNVVVLRVKVKADGNVPRTEMISHGEAWVSTGGATVHGTWRKASATEPIRLLDAGGVDIRLSAGNTWVELVPTSGAVRFTAP
jgi:hypothetical protein